MKEVKLTNYSEEVLKKFRTEPKPNKELMDQLKMLPDDQVELFRKTYPKLVKDKG